MIEPGHLYRIKYIDQHDGDILWDSISLCMMHNLEDRQYMFDDIIGILGEPSINWPMSYFDVSDENPEFVIVDLGTAEDHPEYFL